MEAGTQFECKRDAEAPCCSRDRQSLSPHPSQAWWLWPASRTNTRNLVRKCASTRRRSRATPEPVRSRRYMRESGLVQCSPLHLTDGVGQPVELLRVGECSDFSSVHLPLIAQQRVIEPVASAHIGDELVEDIVISRELGSGYDRHYQLVTIPMGNDQKHLLIPVDGVSANRSNEFFERWDWD